MSKSNQSRRTPSWLFDFLSEQLGPFGLDAAADRHNALCESFYDVRNSALDPECEWAPKTFCNPPFRNMKPWVQKAVEQAEQNGYHTVMIAPAGGSQDWFHDLARRYTILMPNARISFDDENGNPTGIRGVTEEDGADRDTTILVIGPGFENPAIHPGPDDGAFRQYALDVKPAYKAWLTRFLRDRKAG